MRPFFSNIGWRQVCAIFMVVLMLVPASLFLEPERSEAQVLEAIGAVSGALAGCVLTRYGIDLLEFVEDSLASVGEAILGLFGIELEADAVFDDFLDSIDPDIFGAFGGDTVPVTVEAYGDTALEQTGEVLRETVGESVDSIAASESQSVWKECFLDPIAWRLAEWLIVAITDDLVTWINSGFEGAPAFVTDLDGFLLEVGDNVLGDIIESSDLAFLCDPFELDVRIALTVNYFSTTAQRSACTLTDVVENIDNFLAGDFNDGGWRGWFELTAEPHNNRYGAYLGTSREVYARIINERGEEIIGFDWSRGFRADVDEEGNVQTPGAVIETQLQRWLDAPREQLVVADEIDEVLSALFEHFITELLSGVGGLLGYNQPDASGESFSDRVKSANSQTFELYKERLIGQIDATIASEQQQGQTEFIGELQTLRGQVDGISSDASDRFAQIRNAELQLLDIRNRIRARDGGITTGGTTGGIVGGGATGGATGGVPPPPPPPPPPGGGTTGGTTSGGAIGGGTTGGVPPPPPPPPPPGGATGGITGGGSTTAPEGVPGGVPELPAVPPQDFI